MPFRPKLLAAAIAALAFGAASLPSQAIAAPAASSPAHVDLQQQLDGLATKARPGMIGIAIVDVSSGKRWSVHGSEPFAMMSAFKAPVAVAVLDLVDQGKLKLDQEVTLAKSDVQGGSAVPSVGAAVKGGRSRFTVRDLLVGSVSQSDNTAVNALIKLVGGPAVVTAKLKSAGIEGMRVDMDEVGIEEIFEQLPRGAAAPKGETDAQEDTRLANGYAAFLADARNRTTPEAAMDFLGKLASGKLLTPSSTALLLKLMRDQVIPNRLRAGLPKGVDFADKTGTSGSFNGRTGAFNDMGIITFPDGRRVLISAFLRDSPATEAQRNALFADIGKTVYQALQAAL
ncbi:class A beta-lactamase [Pinirhizobacter soli]|uniref:class A beta-lactamase n=1 Tax=Pinirhizobacter soli TaxID=2786953 RepID=UPI00202A449F|nr:class A beta-lactamase [Pinirhizobacter soli]